MDYQHILQSIQNDLQPLAQVGKQADYIPALAAVNPDQWGICIETLECGEYALGDADVPFSLPRATLSWA